MEYENIRKNKEVLTISEGGTYSGSTITAVFSLHEKDKAIEILEEKVREYNEKQEMEVDKLVKREGDNFPIYIESGMDWGSFISLQKEKLTLGNL